MGPGTNTGHGHVWERPDGMKARCGGPGLCTECSKDLARYRGELARANREKRERDERIAAGLARQLSEALATIAAQKIEIDRLKAQIEASAEGMVR